jgi:hypothetical protein
MFASQEGFCSMELVMEAFEAFGGCKESSAAKKRPLLSTFTPEQVIIITVTVTGKG